MPQWVVAEAPEQPEFSLRNAEPLGDEVGPEAREFPESDTVRRAPKRFKFIRRALAEEDIDEVDNIAVLTPRAAIRDAIRAGLPGQLIEQALTTARRRELIDPITEARLRVELADRNQRKYAQTKDKAV